ncbi:MULTISPECIES: PspC domain-containing protein [unclassified Nocardiopsis]|uniref:PspC domain-containing protein n=1 Tax=unclassified Nocardiopsis TaxID=2649073 RepID=UPI000AA35199|nr:PspC domain-containing protein [Nocardiopsis sp. TSRI0078]
MTDDPTPDSGGGASPVSGAPEAGGSERELRKEDEDRVLAGVCAGLGRYTRTDPVVWRTAFVLTAFAGAAGLLLYVAAWMLMRDDRGGPATFEQMLNRSIPPRTVPKLLAVGLAVATAFSLVGGFGWSTLVLAVPLVLGLLTARSRGVDLRAAFVRLREDLGSKEPPPTTPPPGPTPTYYNPAQPWASAPQGPVDLAVVAERSAAGSRGDGADRSDGDGGLSGRGSEEAEQSCRRGAPLASLALWTAVAGGVLLPVLVFGWSSSLWSGQTARLLFGPETGVFFLAGVLAVIGVYALVGTRAGDPRGLMSLGLVTALVLALASVTDLTRVRVGGQVWRPATVAGAEGGDHRMTLGSGTLDLTGLADLSPGETVDVSLRVGAGHAELILPEDARVAVTSRVGLGVVDLGGREGSEDMVGYSLTYEEVHEPAAGAVAEEDRSEGGAGPPLINVRTDSVFGVVEVGHGEA